MLTWGQNSLNLTLNIKTPSKGSLVSQGQYHLGLVPVQVPEERDLD